MEKYEKPCMEVINIQDEVITGDSYDESYDESYS